MHNIRNFCIIAHIDHGKSTLADRLLEITKTVQKRDLTEQFLDSMSLERERGVTIKMHPVTMNYSYNNTEYILNLIDTPGHVDFSYEVSRSLAAVEGVILLVDAAQGVQAQTLANLYQALEHDLVIVPVINKIDLPAAQVEVVQNEIVELLGVSVDEIIKVSAKEGTNIEQVIQKVIEVVPPPKGSKTDPLKALVFDSIYDTYRGVVLYVRVFDGSFASSDDMVLMGNKTMLKALEVGIFTPKFKSTNTLSAGSIGYIVSDLKEVAEARVGETVTHKNRPADKALPGLKESKPFVFASFFPGSQEEYAKLKDSIDKLHLTDASFTHEPEAYGPMGYGFRMGFLGLLHMDIIIERLKREYYLEIITTAPHTAYKVKKLDGKPEEIKTPQDFPEQSEIVEAMEPWVTVDIVVPSEFMGKVMELSQGYKGVYKKTEYLDPTRAHITYEFPLSKILSDFYDRLKSVSSGYASMNYDFIGFREGKLAKLDIWVSGEKVDAFSQIVHVDESVKIGKKLVEKLKELIPKQQYKISLQAIVGGKVVAREDISALRKDVTAKLYGGDVSRKRKLLEKQKKGKQKLRKFGSVEIPTDVFVKIIKE